MSCFRVSVQAWSEEHTLVALSFINTKDSLHYIMASFAAVALNEGVIQIHQVWDGKVVRFCTITIINETKYDFVAEGTNEESGLAEKFPERIEAGSTGIALWVKSRGSATGACGVFHYNLNGKMLNIMVSVPYDWNLYSAWCNVSLTNEKDSFSKLYYDNDPVKAGNWGEITSEGFKFRFMMTNQSQSDMTLYVRHA
jgi:hypothetical protein